VQFILDATSFTTASASSVDMGNARTVVARSPTSNLLVLGIAQTETSFTGAGTGIILEQCYYNGTAYVTATAGLGQSLQNMAGFAATQITRESVVTAALLDVSKRWNSGVNWSIRLRGSAPYTNTAKVLTHTYILVEFEP
jgi:hypothetical protein